MVCRVCKKELTNPICDFCGEDNSPYMQEAPAEKVIEESKEAIGDKKKKSGYKEKSRYKLNKKKLLRFVVIVVCIIFLISAAVRFFGKDENSLSQKAPDNLFTSGMFAVSVNGQWGYINSEDPAIFAVAPQFSHVTDYHGNVAAVCIDGKFSLLNKEGSLVCEPMFDAIGEFGEDGLIAAEKDGKWGYIDENAVFKIQPKFTSAHGFSKNGIAVVSVGGSFGFIGDDGEYIIAPQYDMALSFGSGNLAPVKTADKWGYIDKTGTSVVEPVFEEAYPFENGLAVVKQYGSYGAIDSEGNMVIKPRYDQRFYFDGDHAVVCIGNRYGIIDKNGAYVIYPQYKALGLFGPEGLAFAQRADGLWGHINMSDEFVITAKYEKTGDFALGYAPVKKDGLWGFIDKDGNMVIEPKYLDATGFFDDGYACVTNVDGSIVVINTQGRISMVESATAIDNVLK